MYSYLYSYLVENSQKRTLNFYFKSRFSLKPSNFPMYFAHDCRRITKKLLKQSKYKDCENKLTVHDQDLQNDQYLTLVSRGGLTVLPRELTEFMYSCFAIFDFVECDILSIGQVTRSAMYILKYYDPKCTFCCQYHLDWGVKFASRIVVNVYFSNKQKQVKDCVHKELVESFKTRQQSK